jgi:DNA polymerase-3 subunit chi
MTQVDFYLLQLPTVQDRLLFACRLANKAFAQGKQIYLHTDNEVQSGELDQLLWTFRPSSFLPHQRLSNSQDNSQQRVLVGHSDAPANHRQLMINLASTVPEFFSRFDRLVEIVVQDTDITANSRINYRFYKDRGYPLDTHDIEQ